MQFPAVIPARLSRMNSGGNPENDQKDWMPASAGMTEAVPLS
jgi:hypothetical protein